MAKSLTEKRLKQQQRQARREARRARRAGKRNVIVAIVATIVALVLLAVPPIFVNNVIGYFPLFAFVLVIALSFAYLQVVKRALTFQEPARVSQCVRGENLPFCVTLGNKSFLPLVRIEPTFFVSDLFGSEDVLTKATVSLAPHETYDFDFGIRFDHIGTYSAGVRSVVVYDLLGLFSATYENDERHTIEVMPRVFDVTGMPFDQELMKETPDARSPISLNGSDYTGVREYVIGDPMKSIHWKLSARSDFYYTKIFETLGTPGVEAILDFHSPEYDAEGLMCVFDGVVESALSMGALAQSQGMDFDLVYRDKDGEDVRISSQKGGRSRSDFVSSLPRVSTTDHEFEALDILALECSSVQAQRNIVLCTATLDEQVIAALLAAKRRQRNPMLVLVVPPDMPPEERKAFTKPLRQLDAVNITCMTVSSALDLGGAA